MRGGTTGSGTARGTSRPWLSVLPPVTLRVSVLSVGLLGGAALLLLVGPAGHGSAGSDSPWARWWVLAVLFGLTELTVLHVQHRREAQTVSLSEIPLLLGLFFATPGSVTVGWLAGSALVLRLHRRQRPLKLAFNLAQILAQATSASTLFALLRPADDGLGWQVCLVAYASVMVSSAVSGLATTAVIALYEGSLRVLDLVREPAWAAVTSVAVSSVGLLAVYALHHDRSALLPLLVCGLVLLLAYRSYASLSERHESLGRLHQFQPAVTGTPDVDEVLLAVLRQAKDLLRAEWAEDTVLPAVGLDGPRGAMHVQLDASGHLQRHASGRDDPGHLLYAGVARSGRPLLITRASRDQREQAFLQQRGVRDALLAPLQGDGQMIGALTVADRVGDVRRFDDSDIALLETVANHASVALRNGQLIDRLRHESLYDVLTGLPNRELLRQRLTSQLQRLDHGTTPALTVLLLDLDGFKDVNDTFGHHRGDQLLVEVGRRLQAATGAHSTVARLGGDEYAVVVPGLVDAAASDAAGTRLLQVFAEPVLLDGVPVQVGASIGISRAPDDASTRSELLRCADLAMYAAKRAGAGARRYDPSLDTQTAERLQLLAELRAAVDTDQLVVHVQPKAELNSGAVTGVEALVRWEHPQRGLIFPDTFIDLAEANGLMPALTRNVLRQATRAAARWHWRGERLSVAVNVSPRSLSNGELAHGVAEALRESNLPPELLTLEITESTIMGDLATANALLAELTELGVRLSVDDFGTGYSSLSYLKRLPVDEMKVDRSFVRDMAHDAEEQVIVRTIIGLGTNLGLTVVAEGVEDQATWDLLRQMGCTYIQGYQLSRPMPEPDFLPWLDAYRSHSHTRTAPATPAVGSA